MFLQLSIIMLVVMSCICIATVILLQVSFASSLAESLEVITAESSLFHSLDFTIASLVLENLVTSDEIVIDDEIQMSFVQTVSNLMTTRPEVAGDSEAQHQSVTR